MTRLNQLLAVEKGTKTRAFSTLTQLNKTVQKPALFQGFAKTYRPKDEDGERFPPEAQRVQTNARDVLDDAARVLTDLFDVTAAKDAANRSAKADLVVDGEVLLKDVPATTLLFLEKQLGDVLTLVKNLPTLDPSDEWGFDDAANLYKSTQIVTGRTKKVQRPIVLYDATTEHPAQTQLVSEDVLIGHWESVKHSAALPPREKQKLEERVTALIAAVKFAREEANQVNAPTQHIGKTLFDHLLGN